MRALILLGLVLVGAVGIGGQEPGTRPEIVEQPDMGIAVEDFGLAPENRKPPGFPLAEGERPAAYGLRLPLVRQDHKKVIELRTQTWIPHVTIEEDQEGELELLDPPLDDIIVGAFRHANPMCMYWLGLFYEKGMKRDGTQILDANILEAVELYMAAESWGLARAALAMGRLHDECGHVTEALRSYVSALKKGELEGAYPLGDLLLGRGMWKAAMRVWSAGASCGCAKSMSGLGILLSRAGLFDEEGGGGEAAMQMAVELFTKAAEMGDGTAMCELGQLWESGVLGPINMTEVVAYYACAAEQGDPMGMKLFARCLREGDGVERNMTAADEWEELSGYVDPEEEEGRHAEEILRTHEAISQAEESLLMAGRPSRYYHHPVPFRPLSDVEMSAEEDIGWDGAHDMLGQRCKWKYLDNDFYSKLEGVYYSDDFVRSTFTAEDLKENERIDELVEKEIAEEVRENLQAKLALMLGASREYDKLVAKGASKKKLESMRRWVELAHNNIDEAVPDMDPTIGETADEMVAWGDFNWFDKENFPYFLGAYLPHLIETVDMRAKSAWPALAKS